MAIPCFNRNCFVFFQTLKRLIWLSFTWNWQSQIPISAIIRPVNQMINFHIFWLTFQKHKFTNGQNIQDTIHFAYYQPVPLFNAILLFPFKDFSFFENSLNKMDFYSTVILETNIWLHWILFLLLFGHLYFWLANIKCSK